jgi:hypothetical protein
LVVAVESERERERGVLSPSTLSVSSATAKTFDGPTKETGATKKTRMGGGERLRGSFFFFEELVEPHKLQFFFLKKNLIFFFGLIFQTQRN